MSLLRMIDQRALRQQLKRLRSSLTADARAQAQSSALHRVLRHPRFRLARRIAAYVGSRGELDPMPVIEYATRRGKECYLPVLHPFRPGHLWFCRWQPGDPLVLNRFGIQEPVPNARNLIPARRLHLVIVPLLGFDSACHRLGMGGGYYDRTFAFVRRQRCAKRPFLLGLAYESQHVETLITQPWDIQLDAVVTNRRMYIRRIKNGICVNGRAD